MVSYKKKELKKNKMKNILITMVYLDILVCATAIKLSKKYKVFGSYNLNVDLERKKNYPTKK